ncbi:HAMP domain-containing sensor histidine kinase, partial [Deinococcus sp. 23YEL01]|uniref:sensor histidine kinase n=1 Tax=Deinococcus sp. 23YEL01 TaxID=2745871 RepID=UPI001E58DC63|nr:HAMP domain-containing histidine kinase [Deinococcus sp. 23YEL01]
MTAPTGRQGPARLLLLARELLLAVLPGLLTTAVLLATTLPAYNALKNTGTGWTPYAYQGFAQDVLQYQVSRHPDVPAEDRERIRLRALSSALNRAQFGLLDDVERLGERRLSVVARNLQEDTDTSAARAVQEALGLSAQATEYAKGLGSRYEQELLRLRSALIGTSALTGLLSALLILRALLMWRGEHLRTRQREERQIEALNLASHEMRRPLQTLLLASDLLRRAETPDQQQRLLSMIEDSASQISNRADLGRLKDLYLDVTLNPQRTDLRPLLRRFSAERVHVVTADAPVPWPVDAGRFRQMIENLVENALKYTDGVVEVSLGTPGGRPQVQVRDFGPGMSAELQGRVFEPYER